MNGMAGSIDQMVLITGSLRKKTNDVPVRINHLFFHDVQPIPNSEKKLRKKISTFYLSNNVRYVIKQRVHIMYVLREFLCSYS